MFIHEEETSTTRRLDEPTKLAIRNRTMSKILINRSSIYLFKLCYGYELHKLNKTRESNNAKMNALCVMSAVFVALAVVIVNSGAAPANEPCVGCPATVDVNDSDVQRVANLAVAEVQKSSNSPYQHRLVRVVEATSQVVSGTKYVLTIEVGHDEPKDGDNNVQVTQRCQVEIWSQPWLNKNQVTVKSCNNV
ncbi:hypothetical protein L9F63_017886 [Diploptera punctata]|uniref:Cystatin domain-containing protein n=1 Tax=Diploptera punctata TaxID=6984 RepID=A0AAD7ZZU7_DIPPU|nr:hypothetical protein L9F63_017886 [Diploptera punctata]